jgi:membrane protease YdiL (CAAX protease family)
VSRGRVVRRRASASWAGHGDLFASLVLIFPLLLVYEIGVLFSSTINGVDLITRGVYAACGRDRLTYLVVHACAAAGFLVWMHRSRQGRTLSLDVVLPLVLEAAIYALCLGAVVGLVVEDVLGLATGLSLGGSGEAVVMSLGAGVHEELVFRLGLFAGGARLLTHAGVAPRTAHVFALATSCLLFAAAHHWGAYGEPWAAGAFAYRTLAGASFAAIFWYRSLAHAVYAHALYDVWVLVVQA